VHAGHVRHQEESEGEIPSGRRIGMNGRPEILTAAEVARLLKVSRRTVYALHQRGLLIPSHQLPSATTGTRRSREGFRWTMDDVESFLCRNRYRPSIVPREETSLGDFIPVELPKRNRGDKS
jgi:hypothetical protein